MQNTGVCTFNAYSKNYTSGNRKLEKYHEYRIATFLDLVNKHFPINDMTVVDYGCGDGMLAEFFPKQYIGIDPSEEMIRLAISHYPEKNFKLGALEKLEAVCKESNPDMVVCLNTLPYMNVEETHKFFEICSNSNTTIIVSHTNELLDLCSMNRYTIEHRKSLLTNHAATLAYMPAFEELFSHPDLPRGIPQTQERFGSKKLNVSERDTLKKYRVDPFTWVRNIAEKFGLQHSEIFPIRIFALPPHVLEAEEKAFDMLHSDYFDTLPLTYRIILCSQFRVIFSKVRDFPNGHDGK